jgi:hypothetical protein
MLVVHERSAFVELEFVDKGPSRLTLRFADGKNRALAKRRDGISDRETEATTVQVFQSIGRLAPWPYRGRGRTVRPRQGKFFSLTSGTGATGTFDVDQRRRFSLMLNELPSAVLIVRRIVSSEVRNSLQPIRGDMR